MTPRSLRLAYAIPPLVSLVLAFFLMTDLDQRGAIGTSHLIRVSETGDSRSNAVVIAALDRTADASRATLIRIVADRTEPATRRTFLTTTARGSTGADLLAGGYPDFDPGVTTHVVSMAALTRSEPSGDYEVLGAAADADRFERAFRSVGYDTERFDVPSVLGAALDEHSGERGPLILVTSLICVVLCLIGTIGTPRRAALRRLSGWSVTHEITSEARTAATSVAAALGGAAVACAALAPYNGLAQFRDYAIVAAELSGLTSAPVVVAHVCGVVLAARLPIAASVLGRRPAGALVIGAQVARYLAIFLLVPAVFGAVESIAVVRAGEPERELRAAGDAVDLRVTPDPRPGSLEKPYWEHLGAFARDAMIAGDALLAAKLDIAAVGAPRPQQALIVDDNYLVRQPLRSSDGGLLRSAPQTVTVWVPEARENEVQRLVDDLESWYLRDAVPPDITTIETGVLAPDQRPYSYSTSDEVAPWLDDDAVVVVVPRGAVMFEDEFLGAWISTTDIAFASPAAAAAQLRSHGLGREVSAVVPIGQAAAERARDAVSSAWTDSITAIAAACVAGVTLTLAISTRQRRFGTSLFARHVAGWSFVRANLVPLIGEGALAISAVSSAVTLWWDRRPTSTGMRSVLDPGTSSALAGLLVAVTITVALAVAGITAIAVIGRRAVRDHGKET